MNIRESFLADIIANPADDTPRLIYADWLEEQGDGERGEFIRMQCELASMEHPQRGFLAADMNMPGGKRVRKQLAKERRAKWDSLNKRELDAWLAGRAYWSAELPGPLADATNELDWWRRGFIPSLTCTSADFLAHAPAILSAQPIETVTLTDWEVVAFHDAGDYEMDHFGVTPLPGSAAEFGFLLNASFPDLGWIPTLSPSAAEALATFSQTLILFGRSRIKPLPTNPFAPGQPFTVNR